MAVIESAIHRTKDVWDFHPETPAETAIFS